MCGQYLMHAQSLAQHSININNELFDTGIQLYAQTAMYIKYVQQDIKNAKQTWEKILPLVQQHYAKDRSSVLVLANIYTHLSNVMRQIGDINQAIKYVEKAILIYESNPPKVSANLNKLLTCLRYYQDLTSYYGIKCDQSYALYNLGLFKQDSADFRAAKGYYEKALAILGKGKLMNSTMLYKVSLLEALGHLCIYCGDIKNANNILNSAITIGNKNFPNHLEQAYVYERISNLQYYIGQYSIAKENLAKCLQIRLAILSKDHYRIGYAKSALGLILCTSNYIDEGIANLKQAEIIHNKNFAKGHLRFAFLYINMSYAFEMHKEYDKALQYLIKAQKVAMTNWGIKARVIFSHYFTPIEKLLSLDKSDKDINYYMQALDLTKELFGIDHIRVARYHYLLGQAFENINDRNKARQQYQEALNIASKQQFNDESLITGNQENIDIIQEHLSKL